METTNLKSCVNPPPSSFPACAPVKICSAVCPREFKQGSKGHSDRSHPLSTYLLSLFSPHNPFLNVWAGTAEAVYDSQNGGALKHVLFGHDLLNNKKKVDYKPPLANSRNKNPAQLPNTYTLCPALELHPRCHGCHHRRHTGGKKGLFCIFLLYQNTKIWEEIFIWD